MKHSFTLRIIAVLILAVMLAGCGGGIAQALRVVGVSALMSKHLDSDSRLVKIIADVLSATSLKQVIARIIRANGTEVITVIMTQNAEGKYEGSCDAAALGTQPETLSTIVTATDASGNQAESAPVAVEVPAADPAP